MSGQTTKRMLAAYFKEALPTMFFSGLFRTSPQSFYNSEEVEIDIMRSEEDVSVVVTDIGSGYRMNAADLYTNKGFKAPVHKEALPLNGFDLMKREPGRNPFEDPSFQADAIVRAFRAFRKVEAKIRRAIELQSSQVMQTGTVTLTDINGTALYNLDYKAKASHFPTAAVAWDGASPDPLGDLRQLGDKIRADGLTQPDTLIFGDDAFEAFVSNPEVQKRLDNRRIVVGEVAPQMGGEGATYQGRIQIGHYSYAMWTYSGRYKHPQTGVSTPFMAGGKVVMLSSGARLDATFGAIPRIVAPEQRVLPFLPGRMSSTEAGIDLFTNAWVDAAGETLFAGCGARPLMIPTDIDSFGCLNTGL